MKIGGYVHIVENSLFNIITRIRHAKIVRFMVANIVVGAEIVLTTEYVVILKMEVNDNGKDNR